MTDAPPLAERSAGTPPVTSADFESFYLAHRVRLFRALVVVTRDVCAAEEVAQEAFVRVWERWDRVRDMEDRPGYLYRTASNGWFQVHRRALRAARRIAAPGRVVDPLEIVEDRDVVARRLLELPTRQRAALVLTEYLGHDSTEAGRALGIRSGTVRRLASKGRAALRRGHDEEGETL
jgi:RNA polymerase sigma-70 factor (ECF subfamily)